MTIKDTRGREASSMIIFTMALEYMKKHLLDALNSLHISTIRYLVYSSLFSLAFRSSDYVLVHGSAGIFPQVGLP